MGAIGLDPLKIAATLWDETHAASADTTSHGDSAKNGKLYGQILGEAGPTRRAQNRLRKPILGPEAE